MTTDAGSDGLGSEPGGPLQPPLPSPPPLPLPLQPFEPPYYAVIFTSLRTQGDHGYGEVARRMEELVREVPGFLGVESARTPGGLGITVGYFDSAGAIEAWRSQVEHRAAQERGRDQWYEGYAVHISKVERSYAFVREQ
ncbi:antibiotic biosynthesis monooxygenase [Streptomyces sp. B-S-A8]|uniref:Antibiotic biosynthesis monooxygenase n=1 Tax=Streptomyces solicavernae TaxID=3043614 RepID=A0ABT6RW54_9ACTN|nr:antibiotic biosynthesis monooxygenase [Streptomyces sp. B-S-A8]MDI3388669.1 antibiotic biosynthesis monooxygenase [Streptomyces sp. B-S-A8]